MTDDALATDRAAAAAPWGAILALAAHEYRRRWGTVIALGVASGIVAGVALAIYVAMWRTSTAYDRLVHAGRLDDVRIVGFTAVGNPAQQDLLAGTVADGWQAILARRDVVASQKLQMFIGRGDGPDVNYVSVSAPEQPFRDVATPIVIRGRAPDAARPDEVMIEETRAARSHLQVGATVGLDLLTPEQYQQFSTGISKATGGHVLLRVVGVYRVPKPQNGFDSLIASPAFDTLHQSVSLGRVLLVQTRGHAGAGAGPGSIAAQVHALNRTALARFGPSQRALVSYEEPRRSPDPALGPTLGVLRVGLLALTIVVAMAGLILGGQIAGRWAESGRDNQRIESALGLRPRDRVGARLIAALPAVLLTALFAAAGALVGGMIEPLGSISSYEPRPGWVARPQIAVVGALLAAILVAGVVVVTAMRAASVRRAPARKRGSARPIVPLGRVTRLAVALTYGRGGARTSMPVRSMIVGLATMLAALVIVSDVHAQLAHLAGDKARWGWTADFSVSDDTPQVDARLVADPRVRDVEQVLGAPVDMSLAGREVSAPGYGRRTLRGHLPWTMSSGRLPRTPSEVALGPRAARDLKATVGDRITFTRGNGSQVRLRVVGIVVLAAEEREPLGQSALLTADGLTRAASADTYSGLLIRAISPAAASSLRTSLRRTLEIVDPTPPDTVSAIDELGTPTRVLTAILLVAAALLAGQNARLLLRRRSTQLAIADAMGMPRGELIATSAGSLLFTSAVAAVIGLPLGWAVSRIVLVEVGPRLGLALHRPDVVPALLAGGEVLGLTLILGLVASAWVVQRGPLWARPS